jgi:hypothetical protein
MVATMWLFWFIVPLVIFVIAGGLLAGGIFTIVFIPIVLVILAIAVVSRFYGKSPRRRTLPRDQPTATGPHTGHVNVSPSPSTPGELTDARREAQ